MAMTTDTHLVTELGVLEVHTIGPATAGIWLVTDGSEFPMTGWNDFIVVILDWWAAALLRLWRNTSTRERVHFMDGPYAVEVSREESERLQLRMFAGFGEGNEVAAGEADIRRFLTDLATQSRKVLDECRLRGWWSRDEEALASHLQDIDRELTN